MRKLLYTDEPKIQSAYDQDTYGCLRRIAYGLFFLGVVVAIILLF